MTCSYCAEVQKNYPQVTLRACGHDVDALDAHTPLHQPKPGGTRRARVFIHPRCYQGPASGALISCFQQNGYDISGLSIGPANRKGYCELVRLLGTEPDGLMRLERMDGHAFDYRSPPERGRAA